MQLAVSASAQVVPPSVFESAQFGAIRVVERGGDPWFVAKDIAERLGYANSRKAIRDHCKKPCSVGRNESFPLDPQTVLIGQADVLRLIVRSSLPAAEQFEKWIFEEVLPSVLKHGMYATPQTVEAMLADPDATIRILTELKSERERRLEAERTKAEIGSRREATAMATASAAVRESNRLRNELGCNSQHATIIAVQKVTGKEYDWVPIRRWCRANNLLGKKVVDPRWGVATAWPAEAWKAVHGVDLSMVFAVPVGEA